MVHEISHYDIQDRQLLEAKTQSSAGRRKDIGEAIITHTIFGKARVRIIREQDKIRRAWLLAALAVAVLAAAAWQGWIAMNRTTAPPLSAKIRVGAPAFQPEYLYPAARPSPVGSKPGTPSQTETINPGIIQNSAPQQAPGQKASGQVAAKPVAPQPLIASKLQTTPLAANSNPVKNQTDMQQRPKQPAPIQPANPVVKTPIATPPAASSTAAAATLASPLVKEVISTPSPARINQPSSSVNAQSK